MNTSLPHITAQMLHPQTTLPGHVERTKLFARFGRNPPSPLLHPPTPARSNASAPSPSLESITSVDWYLDEQHTTIVVIACRQSSAASTEPAEPSRECSSVLFPHEAYNLIFRWCSVCSNCISSVAVYAFHDCCMWCRHAGESHETSFAVNRTETAHVHTGIMSMGASHVTLWMV